MLESISSRLKSEWNSFFPGSNDPGTESIYYTGITGSAIGGTTSFIGFSSKQKKPLFVVKVFRDSHSGSKNRMENEVRVLRILAHAGLMGTIPRVIDCGEIEDCIYLVQSYLPGKPFQLALDGRGNPRLGAFGIHIEKAFSWVCRLYSCSPKSADDDFESFRKTKKSLIEDFSKTFEISNKEIVRISDASSWIESTRPGHLCIAHNDFCRQNILGAGRTIGVIDWSDCGLAGFAGFDLLFFCATYFLQQRSNCGLEGFTDAFSFSFMQDNEYCRLIFTFLIRYCRLSGTPVDGLGDLMTMFLIERAMSDFIQISQNAKQGRFTSFTVLLSKELGIPLKHIGQAQFWIYLFRLFSKDFAFFGERLAHYAAR